MADDEAATGGYATAAAVIVSLAISVVAIAVAMRSIAALKAAKADLRRTQIEYALDSAQVLTGYDLLRSAQAGRLHWSQTTDEGLVEVLAEPAVTKVGLTAASVLGDEVLAQIGAADPAGARRWLAEALAGGDKAADIADADRSAAWKTCAPSLISPYGLAKEGLLIDPATPDWASPSSRAGEVWRIRAVEPTGWVDDRVVRFTGRPDQPFGVISRKFEKRRGKDRSCTGLKIAEPRL